MRKERRNVIGRGRDVRRGPARLHAPHHFTGSAGESGEWARQGTKTAYNVHLHSSSLAYIVSPLSLPVKQIWLAGMFGRSPGNSLQAIVRLTRRLAASFDQTRS